MTKSKTVSKTKTKTVSMTISKAVSKTKIKSVSKNTYKSKSWCPSVISASENNVSLKNDYLILISNDCSNNTPYFRRNGSLQTYHKIVSESSNIPKDD
jgi:hypothetical protein